MSNKTCEIDFGNIPPDLEYDESITLWRYMSFASLCEMLIHNFIPLINIKKFSDKSEGTILKAVLPKLFMNRKNYAGCEIDEDIIDYVVNKYFKHTYISSWCRGDSENAAMWDRYTHGSEGIAIKTNAKLLIDCIKNPYMGRKDRNEIASHEQFSDKHLDSILPTRTNLEGIFIPKIIIKPVEYIENNPEEFSMQLKQFKNGYDRMCFYYKMSDFKDESEIRISYMKSLGQHSWLYMDRKGIDFKKDWENSLPVSYTESYTNDVHYIITSSSNDLIEQIVVSPYAHKTFISTVLETRDCINLDREKAGLDTVDCEIIQSRRSKWV